MAIPALCECLSKMRRTTYKDGGDQINDGWIFGIVLFPYQSDPDTQPIDKKAKRVINKDEMLPNRHFKSFSSEMIPSGISRQAGYNPLRQFCGEIRAVREFV